MFTTLLETGAVTRIHASGPAASIVVHGIVIAAALAFTVSDQKRAPEIRQMQTVVYVPVKRSPNAIAPPAQRPRTSQPAIDAPPALTTITAPAIAPTLIPAIDVTTSSVTADELHLGSLLPPGGLTDRSSGTAPDRTSGDAIDVLLADRIPVVLGRATSPRYPSSLRDSGIPGHVVAQFVVDTLGRVEMRDVQILETSHSLFGAAVRAALAQYRFVPGEAGGRRARVMMQQAFTFTLR